MAIVSLGANDTGATSRTVINDNFADLDTTKADLASPTFTGTPTLPTGTVAVTQTAGDNSTKVATTAYVDLAAQPTQFVTTQVFSGTASTTYTDLDLSSVVGARQRMVMLVVVTNNTDGFHARRKGTSYSYVSSGATSYGVSAANTLSNIAMNIIVATDVNGVIQWRTNGAANTVTINVEAYW